MSASDSQPGNMPATLSTIPLEIFRMVMFHLEDRTLLVLRIVCKELNHRTMERVRRCFGYIRAVFNRQSLCRILELADSPNFQRFAEVLNINMTIDGRVLASPFEPGWERDGFGYFIYPEMIYEIRTLKSISSKLRNCTSFELLYYIGRDKKGDDWAQISLRKTLKSVLAVCAAMGAHIKSIKMGTSSADGHIITIDPTHLVRQWDKSTLLLDTTCGHLQALEITLERDMSLSDQKWIEMFLLKCCTLDTLSLKNKSSSFAYTSVRDPPQHPFFEAIAASPRTVPPVQTLMLKRMDFSREDLMRFVGRFKDTIRSIDLCRVNMTGVDEWPPFLDWLRENIPNLEKFGFQGLTHDFSFAVQKVICFETIFNNPKLNFKTLRGAPWKSYAKLSSGTLALDMPDRLAFLEMGKFFVNLDEGEYKLDSKPRENRQVYTVGFEGSNSSAREALRLLARAATPQDFDRHLTTNSTGIDVW